MRFAFYSINNKRGNEAILLSVFPLRVDAFHQPALIALAFREFITTTTARYPVGLLG